MTNNTYVASHGYWHAPYHNWYPYPYNYFDPARGYFHGGQWSPAPHESTITASRPLAANSSGAGKPSSSSHISRGGFGGHSSSAGS